jgi:hypothetical protein
MKKKCFLVCFVCFMVNLSSGQAPLPPPPPSQKVKKADLIYGDPDGKDNKKSQNSKVKTTGVKNSTKVYGEDKSQQSVERFDVKFTESTNPNSVYYYKNVEALLQKGDTTAITAAQIISLTKYKIHSKTINPTYLDSLARKVYKLNEDKKYNEAIIVGKEILNQSPNNITGHKELSYTYKRLGNTELCNLHFSMMVKIIASVFKYGEGSRESPYILNNFFEGVSIYEARFGLYPQKTRLILTKEKVLLGGYDSYHIMRFSNLTHWLPLLKPEDYKIE